MITDLATARRFVEAVAAGDDALERDRLLILDLLEHHDDLAVRTCRPGHLTASGCVLDASGDAVLLLFHTKLRRWLQPGGHADGETDLSAVALREASEESGIDGLVVDPVPVDLDIHLVAPPDDDPHLHLDVRFLVVAPAGAEPVSNHESEAIRWVGVDDLGGYDVDPGLVRMVRSARDRFAAPGALAQTSPGRPHDSM